MSDRFLSFYVCMNRADDLAASMKPDIVANNEQRQLHEENHVTRGQQYLNQLSLSRQEKENTSGNKGKIYPNIQNNNGNDEINGPWPVLWQYSPVVADRSMINFNLFSSKNFAKETSALLDHRQATVSYTYDFENGGNLTRYEDFTNELLKKKLSGYKTGEPIGYIYYPVFDNFEHNSSTVAIISALVDWKSYFEHILPEGVNGMICVVENTAGQAFTFQIDGRIATFLGLEDMHDPAYAGLVLKANYSAFQGDAEEDAGYTGVPLYV